MSCLTQHGVALMVVLMSLIAADVTAVAEWAEPANVLACRLADYRLPGVSRRRLDSV
jgi:hypothetical protein